ncbi:sigma-70 family RNA polymerase sigma factor [Pseudalkalibacillus caeni]|uniref:Sigma-70 family RNA polymerase sigma factor n=2 Tax=Exobacillus caeni TaxID=2574798 RepID=A0A5R9F9N7_9BACL|nr:sigma-70 family RNA polymerase sigma factor [Pseudalkalibacillus caeni]
MQKALFLEELLENYGEAIVRLAYTYVKDWGKAEDITQEVFLTCYLKLDTYRGEASLKNWIYRIAINRCHDTLRSWSFRNIFVTNVINKFMRSEEASPEFSIVQKEEYRKLRQEILDLPLKYREPFILFYHEELSVKEIGGLLELKISTVKSRLFRARQLLEAKLGPERG